MHLQITGSLTAAHAKRHIPHEFNVPEGLTELTISLTFAPLAVGDVRNMLTLTIFDPNGFRGAGHRGGSLHKVTLAEHSATKGYFAGLILPGEWIVQIDSHMIMPGRTIDYVLTIDGSVGTQAPQPPQIPQTAKAINLTVINNQPGWYRGDLHSHTLHSDASWDVADLVAAAKEKGLDFIFLTDHNTTSPLAEMFSYTTPSLLTLGGLELTTFWGHAVCLGATEWIDWRVDELGDGMAAVAEQMNASPDKLFIIAHPRDIGDPYCTGCAWIYPKMHPGPARLVEVWNGPWWDGQMPSRFKNENSLRLWYRWLNEGVPIYATAGSDVHGPKQYADGPGFNVVYAQELSHHGIIDGVRRGSNYLSSGPKLSFTAQVNGDIYPMGEQVPTVESVAFTLSWAGVLHEAMVQVVVNGSVYQAESVSAEGEITWSLNSHEAKWCLVELRGENGEMLALTNPIFLNP